MKAIRRLLVSALFLLAASLSQGASVIIEPGAPVELPGSVVAIGDSLSQQDLISLLTPSGSTTTFSIYTSTGSFPGALLGMTGTFMTVAPGDTEQPLLSSLSLPAGNYWLVVWLTRPPTEPDTSTITGYGAMPFNLAEEFLVSGVGIKSGDDFNIFLRADPIPEPATLSLAALGVLGFYGRRRRRCSEAVSLSRIGIQSTMRKAAESRPKSTSDTP